MLRHYVPIILYCTSTHVSLYYTLLHPLHTTTNTRSAVDWKANYSHSIHRLIISPTLTSVPHTPSSLSLLPHLLTLSSLRGLSLLYSINQLEQKRSQPKQPLPFIQSLLIIRTVLIPREYNKIIRELFLQHTSRTICGLFLVNR